MLKTMWNSIQSINHANFLFVIFLGTLPVHVRKVARGLKRKLCHYWHFGSQWHVFYAVIMLTFLLFLGVGSQFLALATGIMIMAVMGMFNVHRHGAINTAGIILYAFTSCMYTSVCHFYRIFLCCWPSPHNLIVCIQYVRSPAGTILQLNLC